MYQHILAAVETHEEGQSVLARARDLARQFGARISVVHVVEYLPVDPAGDALLTTPVDLSRERTAQAEARLRAETERARQEANARLEAEVAAAKAEAEQRRAAELEEVRAQVLRLRTAAAEQARAAAEQAVAAEVARANALTPVPPPPPLQELATQWASDAFIADDARRQRYARRVPSNKKIWLIGAAAGIVLLVSSVFAFGVLPLGSSDGKAPAAAATPDAADDDGMQDVKVVPNGPTGELRVESTPDGARVMLDGKESGFTPLTLNKVPAGRHLLATMPSVTPITAAKPSATRLSCRCRPSADRNPLRGSSAYSIASRKVPITAGPSKTVRAGGTARRWRWLSPRC